MDSFRVNIIEERLSREIRYLKISLLKLSEEVEILHSEITSLDSRLREVNSDLSMAQGVEQELRKFVLEQK